MQKLGIIRWYRPRSINELLFGTIKQYQERVVTDKELPRITIESINMYHMFRLLDAQQYEKVAGYVGAAANNLLKVGCDFGLMCGNTPHLFWSDSSAHWFVIVKHCRDSGSGCSVVAPSTIGFTRHQIYNAKWLFHQTISRGRN